MDVFDTQLIEARLRDAQFQFEVVGGAAEYAAIPALGNFRPGAVYVVLIREQNAAGDGPQSRNKTAATVTFGVIAVARNYRGKAGAEAVNEVKPVVERIRQALLGWAPAGCSACKWLQGDVLDYDNTHLLWADVFTTSYVMG